jgi:GT2 family glycosyltransferase
LRTLADHLDAHPLAACAGPRLLNPDGTLQMSVQRFPTPLSRFIETRIRARDHRTSRAVDWVKGAALALRRTAFDEARGFDERYFMYFEEVDLCWRLRDLGWQTHFVPAAEVTHVGAASTSQDRSAMARQFERARERFYRDHYAVARAGSFVLMERLRSAVLAGSRLLFTRRPGGAS